MRLYIVRHAETELNKKRILQGNSDSPLTEEGIAGAEKVAAALRNIDFDLVISSDLGRAVHTAEIIVQGQDKEIIQNPMVSEMCFGAWQGKMQEEICTDEQVAQNYASYFKAPEKYVPIRGAERFDQLLHRARIFLDEMVFCAEMHPKVKVLLVTHGAFIKALMLLVKDLDISRFWDPPFTTNLSLTVLNFDEYTIKIEKEADQSYLGEAAEIKSAAAYLK